MTASPLSRWLPPTLCAVLFALLAPFVGVLQKWLNKTFGLGYLKYLVAALVLVALAAFVGAVVRIRQHRRLRYGLLALAAGMVAWQVAAWGIGSAEVDVVERVHLVEFGLLGALFERAFRARHRNVLLPVLVFLAVGLAGLADEWVQWLTPVRVGDGRDVLLNLWAGVVGYLLGVALSSERGRLRRPGPASVRLALGLTSLFLLAAAVFFDTAHLGHEIRDPTVGVFRSWYPAEELARVAEERDRRWGAGGVPRLRPVALEDPYLAEAGFHIIARNRAVEREAWVRAWRENRILERWYGPLLDHRPRSRWPEPQRVHIESEVRARLGPRHVERAPGYRSPVLTDRIAVAPPRALFWLGALLLGGIPGALALASVVKWRFAGPAEDPSAARRPRGRDRQDPDEVSRR